jgi:glycosyltransferase involved in cell wall biosynthesis
MTGDWPEAQHEVLFVAPPLRFSGASLGCLRLAEGLREAGVRVLVLSAGDGLASLYGRAGIPVVTIPWLRYGVLGRFAGLFLRRRLRRLGVQLVHAHGAPQVALGARLARAARAVLVATVYHLTKHGGGWIDWRRVTTLTTLSDALKQDVVNRRAAPRGLIRVVPGGVPPGEEPPTPVARISRPPVIGTLVEHTKPGSHQVVLHAARRLLTHRPDAQLLIGIDEETPQQDLRALVRELGLQKHVTITGVHDVRRLLEVMDVCVLPAVEEGPGQPLLEALAAGRPLLVGAGGSAYAVVQDGDTGVLFTPDRPDELAAAITVLIDDPPLAQRLGAAGRRKALEDFSLDRAARETLDVYRSAGAAFVGSAG